MDEDTLAHVFEPFYTTKPPGEGTGLGLSTVYGLIAQSGGCTYVDSRPAKGTTFTIYLPRVAGPSTSEEKGAGARSAERKRAVLVVESDSAFLTLTTRILKRRGFEVLPAQDGEQALFALDDPSIGIAMLLTELVLPGRLQGEELARSALAKCPGLPVLFMSAHDRDRMIHEGRVDRGVGYLEKPFTADELTSQVRRCLGDDHPADD
jgi:CheY-like chemotaxis protein